MGRSGRKIRLAERYRRNYFIVSVLECNNFLPVRGCSSVSRHRERCRAVAKTRRGKRTRVWLCVARLRYGRIMRGDRTGQGYCQPDGRHSADPRVPFALPATSKLLGNPLLCTLDSISRLGSHPRVLSTGILDSRYAKIFQPTPPYLIFSIIGY